MRAIPRPSVSVLLLLALLALLVAPVTAAAQSGLPPSVTLHPMSAGPGDVVEVTGIDFASDEPVVIELAAEGEAADVAVVFTNEGGYFSELVTLPPEVAPGAWELRAVALDGTMASQGVDILARETIDDGAATAEATSAGLTTSRGSSGTDVLVMIIIGVMLGAIGGGAAYAWRETHTVVATQPGMAAGQDPIWSGSGVEELAPKITAVSEPGWKQADQESSAGAAPATGTAPAAVTSSAAARSPGGSQSA